MSSKKKISDAGDASDLLAELEKPIVKEESIPVETEAQAETPSKSNVAEFAKSKGHKSKEQFLADGGDPDLYLSAEDWSKNYTWLTQIQQLKKQAAEQKEALEYLVEQNKKAEAHGRKQAIEDLKKQQIEAIATGDPDKITAATERLIKEQNHVKPSPVDLLPPGTDPKVVAFVERNQKWFNDDSALNRSAKTYAAAREDELAKTKPYLSLDERFELVEKEVKERFFTSSSAIQAAASVGSSTPVQTKRDDDYSDLAPEHQQMIKVLKKTTRNFNVKNYVEQVREIEKLGDARGVTLSNRGKND